MIFDSDPLYNSILFYILFIIIILLIKPKFLYNQKTNKFKPFGFGKNQSVFCFPTLCIVAVIVLYIIFLGLDILNKALNTPSTVSENILNKK